MRKFYFGKNLRTSTKMCNRRAELFCTILVLIGICKDAQTINITSVNIPELARVGTKNPVILDCDYDWGKSENITSLVIKWYIDQELLYQWIHGSPPHGAEEFRKYIDETYKASDDPNEMYRAVKLNVLSHELTGNVRCLISTQYKEVEAQRKMLVYSPGTEFYLAHPVFTEDSNTLTVMCVAEDVYPWPTLKLRRNRELIRNQQQYHKNHTDGRFTITAYGVLPMEQVQLPEIFRCELTIKDANYTATREYLYNGGAPVAELPRSSILFGLVIAAATISSLVTTARIN